MFFFRGIVDQHDEWILEVTFICLFSICFLANTVSTINFWHKSRKYIEKSHDSGDINSSFIKLRTICLLYMTAIVSMLFFYSCWILSFMSDKSQSNHIITSLFYGIAIICRFIANISFLYFQILRLYLTFENTYYAMKLPVIILHTILITIIAIGISIGWTLVDFNGKVIKYYLICTIILWLAVSAVQIDIARLFSNKLFAIALSIRPSKMSINYKYNYNYNYNYNQNSKNITNEIELTDTQDELLDTIAKQTLLVVVETILFELCILLWILCIITMYWVKNIKAFVIILFIDAIGWTVYLIAVPLTMWLSFVFAQKEYKYGCGKLHLQCLNWYRNSAIRKLSQPQQSSKNEYVLMTK